MVGHGQIYRATYSICCYNSLFHAGVEHRALCRTIERVACGVRHCGFGVAVGADDALHVCACARLPIVEGDLQRFETVVVVGEERNLEATVAAKEVSTPAPGYRT